MENISMLPRIRRRSFLATLSGAPAVIASAKNVPIVTGVQSGDVTGTRGIVWARADRPARMILDYGGRESFAGAQRIIGPHALAVTDFTARIDISDLPPGQDVFYRVTFQDLADGKTLSQPTTGRLRTAPVKRGDVRFVWSGDTAGQGYGINPDWGGMRIYETMRRRQPDFFLHVGDTIYADGPIPAEIRLQGGGLWRNLTTEAKSHVAETLDDFRGAYKYNLLDANVRGFNSEVPQIWLWDDHEVVNNWSPSKELPPVYKNRSVPLLVGQATRAFLEYAPMRHSADESERVYRHIPYGPLLDVFAIDMRSYRGPNTHNRQEAEGPETQFLGGSQRSWLKRSLTASRALWKVIASDMPIGLRVGDGKDGAGRARFEAVANGEGPALGRELEIADLLRFLKKNRVRNVIWLTADTHYTAAHYYDPAKARFTEFDAFWEFMSGPLNAGTFGPAETDDTFGIQVVYQKCPEKGQSNLPPSAGLQFFGEVHIDAASGQLTVRLLDVAGTVLFEKRILPLRRG